MASNDQWNETKAILNELEQLFDRDDDVKDIIDIRTLENEVLAYNEQKMKSAKELIKGKWGLYGWLKSKDLFRIVLLS